MNKSHEEKPHLLQLLAVKTYQHIYFFEVDGLHHLQIHSPLGGRFNFTQDI